MLTYHSRLILLFTTVIMCHNLSFAFKEFKIYTESSGYKCFWRGQSPFCFLRHGCPWGMTTMKTDKRGDGAYCWIGYKTYCCKYPGEQTMSYNLRCESICRNLHIYPEQKWEGRKAKKTRPSKKFFQLDQWVTSAFYFCQFSWH
jgi:hypothetical protein